jgi:integrase
MFVFLAAVTGCRRGEVAGLRWTDFDGRSLTVSRSVYQTGAERGIKGTKTDNVRVVQLDEWVARSLDDWRFRCQRTAVEMGLDYCEDGYIVSPYPDGSTFVSLTSMGAGFRRVADSLDLKHIHLHSLRHFAATELMAQGISARDAADMLGHADAALTLKVYTHATAERQRAAAAVLGNALTP